MIRLRPALVVAHRWSGLTIAGFLIIAGVTGSTLPFRNELSWLCAPALWRANPTSPAARRLSGPELALRVEAATGAQAVAVPLNLDPRHAAWMYVAPRPGAPPLGYDQVVIDPYSAMVKARLKYGAIRSFPRDLPTFLLALHFGFVAGRWGQTAFGIAALIWLLDAMAAVALTLPMRRLRANETTPTGRRGAWLRRWRAAWTIRPHARGHKLTFDLHRAGGLWLWALMMVFAWSAFSMNLSSVHDPITHTLGAKPAFQPAQLSKPERQARLDYPGAARVGGLLLQREASARGFTLEHGERLDYLSAAGAYRYTAKTSLDFADTGATTVWLSSRDGHELAFEPPGGRSVIEKIDAWSNALHEADVLALPYRLFVSAFGLLVTGLAATGVLIWAKKRRASLRR